MSRRALALALALAASPLALPHQPASAAPGLPMHAGTIADLVERVKGAVVSIDTLARRPGTFVEFDTTGGQRGVGSGYVLDPNGFVVTNFHVVRGAAAIRVNFANGRQFPARVVGADPANDLALLKIEATGLQALRFAAHDRIRVGEWVVAIGSPLGYAHTVSVGIISALNRDIALNQRLNFIQTDAAINPGNSGGPLLNLNGEVVAVNTAVSTRGQGIGFAIPAWTAENVVSQLRASGRVTRAWIGVSIRDAGENRGAVLLQATAGGPADRAGMQPEDVVVEVDGQAVRSTRDLISLLNDRRPGQTARLGLMRDGRKLVVNVLLQAAPEAPQ